MSEKACLCASATPDRHSGVPGATQALGEDSSMPLYTTMIDAFITLCESYWEGILPRGDRVIHQGALQARHSVNVQLPSLAKGQSLANGVASSFLTVPPELKGRYTQLKEAALRSCHQKDIPASFATRDVEELEAENAYLRALVVWFERHRGPVTVLGAGAGEVVSSLPSPHPISPREDSPAMEHPRSPSATRPQPLTKPTAGESASPVFRSGSEGSPPPAACCEVSNLLGQIDILREAVRELSQQATNARGHSASPYPGNISCQARRLSATTPSPRCATPTCTTDVRTLHQIILQQQQTIRTLQQEMEDVRTAKGQIEQAMGQLREATAAIARLEEGGIEDEDTGALDDTVHWRSTLHTEDRVSRSDPRVEASSHTHTDYPISDFVARATTAVKGDDGAAAQEMSRMDAEAARELPSERKRAATFGGMRPSLWFDLNFSSEDPTGLPGEAAEEEGDGSSSGMRTPLPRRTVVLHHRFSSATGDTSSVGCGLGTDESPCTRHTQMSCGTMSNRRTSAAGSSAAL